MNSECGRFHQSVIMTPALSVPCAEDAGTYFCRDTRKSDKDFKTIMWDWELKNMMGDKGAFRFLIHLDGVCVLRVCVCV